MYLKNPEAAVSLKLKCVFLVLFLLGFLLHTLDLSYESKWAKEGDESKGWKSILEIPALLFTAWIHQIFDVKRPVAKTVFESLPFTFICHSFHSLVF